MLLAQAFSGNSPLHIEQPSGLATCSSCCSTQQGRLLHTSHAHHLWRAMKLSRTGLPWPSSATHVNCQNTSKFRVKTLAIEGISKLYLLLMGEAGQ